MICLTMVSPDLSTHLRDRPLSAVKPFGQAERCFVNALMIDDGKGNRLRVRCCHDNLHIGRSKHILTLSKVMEHFHNSSVTMDFNLIG